MVFLSGRGGGQWDFLVHSTPAIRLETAGGGTAGLAQLGIVVFELGGVRVGALGMVVGAGGWTRGIVPWLIHGLRSIKGVNRHALMGQT